VKPNVFSQRKPATKPSFSRKRNGKGERAEMPNACNRSLLRSRHPVRKINRHSLKKEKEEGQRSTISSQERGSQVFGDALQNEWDASNASSRLRRYCQLSLLEFIIAASYTRFLLTLDASIISVSATK
jgi:hypothetical protein